MNAPYVPRTDDIVRARSRMRLDPVLRGVWVGRRSHRSLSELKLDFDTTVRAGARVIKRVWLGDLR